MLVVRFEQLSKFVRTTFDSFRGQLLEVGSWCSRSQVKLVYVNYFKFVMPDQLK